MNFSRVEDILMFVGTLIFVPAFLIQVIRLYIKGKHSVNFSPTSWMINYLGRALWVLFGIFLNSASLIIGQILITLCSVPLFYYAERNVRSEGQYVKSLFNKKLFALRIFLYLIVLSLLVLGILAMSKVVILSVPTWVEIFISLLGTGLTAFAFLPQSIKVVKTKNTTSISFYLSLCFILANVFFIASFIYGLSISNDVAKYVPKIIFPIISTLVMSITFDVKTNNMIKKHESL